MRWFFLFILLIFGPISCSRHHVQVQLINPTELNWNDAFVVLESEKLFPGQNPDQQFTLKISRDGRAIPYQILSDGNIGLLLNFSPGEVKKVIIRKVSGPMPAVQKRAHAEISIRKGGAFDGEKWSGGFFTNVPGVAVGRNHFIHDELLRYEGPGWESDKIAYRLYLDSRNAVDIFGKRTKKIILPFVGHDTSRTYHEMNWWGMDVLKVGETFGVGSFAVHALSSREFSHVLESEKTPALSFFHPENVDSLVCTILEDGPLRAGLEILYKGWQVGQQKVDVMARHFITAGSYLTWHEINILKGQVGLVIGAMQPQGTEMHISSIKKPTLRLVLGIPSLAGDSLAVLISEDSQNLPSFSFSEKNNWLKFYAPGIKTVSFVSGALWQKNFPETSFRRLCLEKLKEWQIKLANPIQIKYLGSQ